MQGHSARALDELPHVGPHVATAPQEVRGLAWPDPAIDSELSADVVTPPAFNVSTARMPLLPMWNPSEYPPDMTNEAWAPMPR
jgi:hypothetical protein